MLLASTSLLFYPEDIQDVAYISPGSYCIIPQETQADCGILGCIALWSCKCLPTLRKDVALNCFISGRSNQEENFLPCWELSPGYPARSLVIVLAEGVS